MSTAGAHAAGTKPLSAGGRAALVATDAEVQLSHVGYDIERAMQDLDVVYPVHTLQRLVEEGFIGALAPTVVSTMGFDPHPAGSIIPLDHEWPDDLRARQLRKDAH